MSRTFIRRAGAAAAITALLSTTGAMFASQANASTEDPGVTKGKVISNQPLAIRELPTSNAGSNGALQPRTIVEVECKAAGESIDGNDLWYLLADDRGWVSARYVDNLDPIPYCGE